MLRSVCGACLHLRPAPCSRTLGCLQSHLAADSCLWPLAGQQEVISVAPLLGAQAHVDAKRAKWLHVHVRPHARGLTKILRVRPCRDTACGTAPWTGAPMTGFAHAWLGVIL